MDIQHWTLRRHDTPMARSHLSSPTVWTSLLTLSTVLCAAHGSRSNNPLTARSAAGGPLLTCAAYGKCCPGQDNACGPELPNGDYCLCDDACISWGIVVQIALLSAKNATHHS